MSNNRSAVNKGANKGKFIKSIAIITGIAVLLIAGFFIVKGSMGGETRTVYDNGADLVIPKSEITETVKFYPLRVGSTNMEVLAVKASDGSIRTAFNTCQVCNGSPRAYYKQEGNTLVCQNCGNIFEMDMVEQQRGGCNPVPIMEDEKTDDGINITISKDFIEDNKDLFTSNWKTE